MRITRENKSNTYEEPIDLTEKLFELQEEHRNVFAQKIEGEIFFYRSLGRGEFKTVVSDERFDDLAKEEIICQACTLWPEEYDFENCNAGVPTLLSKAILKNSHLDTPDARRAALEYYREEMFDLDNQITCIINEAFPQFDIEEIDDWDVEKTTKYLSRAEWKLHNLRGLEFREPANETHAPLPEQAQEEGREQTLRGGNKNDKMTPEKIRELQEKFPGIDWTNDSVMQEGESALRDSVDTMSPALRPGFK